MLVRPELNDLPLDSPVLNQLSHRCAVRRKVPDFRFSFPVQSSLVPRTFFLRFTWERAFSQTISKNRSFRTEERCERRIIKNVAKNCSFRCSPYLAYRLFIEWANHRPNFIETCHPEFWLCEGTKYRIRLWLSFGGGGGLSKFSCACVRYLERRDGTPSRI